jgi:hypothetical protein
MAEDNQLGLFAITDELKEHALRDSEAIEVVTNFFERL